MKNSHKTPLYIYYFFLLPNAVPPPRAISAVIARLTLRSLVPYLQLLFDVVILFHLSHQLCSLFPICEYVCK